MPTKRRPSERSKPAPKPAAKSAIKPTANITAPGSAFVDELASRADAPQGAVLFADLRHDQWERRFLCAKRLSTGAGRDEFEALSAVRRRAIACELILLLDDPESRVRGQTAATLGLLRRTEARDALVVALADPNEWVRIEVGDALGRIGDSNTAQVIAGHLESETDAHVRATLVKSIGMIGDEKMLPVLALYLEDPDSRVRANTVEAMAQLNVSKAALKKALLRLVDDPSNRVRANIAMALLQIGELRGREILDTMRRSGDEYMRASAMYALGEVGGDIDRDDLIEKLDDPSWIVRRNAIRALVKHGRKVIADVVAVLESSSSSVKLGALSVIGELRAAEARNAVIPLLEDESGEVRSQAEETLDLLDGY